MIRPLAASPPQQPQRTPNYDWASPELIAEFHIARDLYAAGMRWIPRRSRGHQQADEESRDAPDLVLSIDHELIVCEGKFFHREPRGILEAQLRSQRRQIAYLFRYRPIRAFCHVALLPDPPFESSAIGADAILTWDEITGLSERVLGEAHYVTTRLQTAMDYYRRKHSRVRGLGIDWDGEEVPLIEVIEWCRVFGNDVEIGHDRGETDLRNRGYAYAEQKDWRWRDASGRPPHPTGFRASNSWSSLLNFRSCV
jgi:hypothetical protein